MTTKPTWSIDPTHSAINFSVRHLVFAKVRGVFTRWTTDLALDESDLTQSSVAVSIEAASVNTGTEQRDTHLRSPDFFDAETYPYLTFRSARIEKTGDGKYAVHGDLTIRDTTREVRLAVTYDGSGKDPWGNQRMGFTARTSIDRHDFGLNWNMLLEAGGVTVGPKVEIEIEIEAVAAAAAKEAA